MTYSYSTVIVLMTPLRDVHLITQMK